VCASVSPDGFTVCTAGSDNNIRVCSLLTGEVHCQFYVDSPDIRSLHTSSDSSIIFSLSAAGSLNLHDLDSGILFGSYQTCNEPNESRSLCIPAEPLPRSVVVGYSDGTIRSIKCTRNEPLRTFSRDHDNVTAMQMFGEGAFVGSEMGNVYHWAHKDDCNSVVQTFVGHVEPVRCISVAGKSGDTLVTGSDDATIRIWSIKSGVELRQIDGCTQAGIFAVAPDCSMLAWSNYGSLFH